MGTVFVYGAKYIFFIVLSYNKLCTYSLSFAHPPPSLLPPFKEGWGGSLGGGGSLLNHDLFAIHDIDTFLRSAEALTIQVIVGVRTMNR